MRRVYVAFVLAGCWGGSPGPAKPTAAKPLLAITQTGFGPVDGKTPATLTALRVAFTGFDVKPMNDADTLEYRVYQGDDMIAYVVPDDDGTIFNVHATSGKITVDGRDWKVGAPFQGASQLTQCECWGENPTCWKQGDHIAVNFARACGDLPGSEPRVLRVLDGVNVQRIVWSPHAFGTAVHHDPSDDGEGEDRD
jgi:hypothetical protein